MASFVLKILGLVTIIYSTKYVKLVIDALSQRKINFFDNIEQNEAVFKYALFSSSSGLVMLLLIGVLLLIFSTPLANRLVGPKDLETQLPHHTTQSIAFSVIGLYLVVTAGPDFLETIIRYYLLDNAGDSQPYLSVGFTSWSVLVVNILKTVIGVLLFLGSRGLTSCWFFFQKSRPMSKINTST